MIRVSVMCLTQQVTDTNASKLLKEDVEGEGLRFTHDRGGGRGGAWVFYEYVDKEIDAAHIASATAANGG